MAQVEDQRWKNIDDDKQAEATKNNNKTSPTNEAFNYL